MKLFNVVLFAAAAAAAAIPMPLSEADVEILRARGVSEADIAHALAPSRANPVASLLRRNIDADGEVQPSHYLSPHPQLTRRWEEGADMSAVEHDGSLTPATREHRVAIARFMDSLMSGRLSGIAAGTGGDALRKRDAEARFVGDDTRANKFWSFGAMNRGMPRLWSGRKGHGASSVNSVNSNANAAANAKALSSMNNNANANAAAKTNSVNAIKGARATEEELTRPERWVYRW